MTKISKTNAARLLDKAGVAYELISYEVDEDDLSATGLTDKTCPRRSYKGGQSKGLYIGLTQINNGK